MDLNNPNNQLDPETEKDLKKYGDKKFDSLIQQVEVEYQLSWHSQYEKIVQNLSRLKLYNNQKKNTDLAGDPLLFTVMQTVLASLYDDQLMVNWEGREQGDADTAANLNDLSRYDYERMGKDVNDYMWDWDALFFGRGLVLMLEFDRDKEFMCPIPERLDPMVFLRDPKAGSVNGDMRHRGGMRFGGYELYLRRDTMTDQGGWFDYKYLRSEPEFRSLLKQAEEQRNDAQNLQDTFNREGTGLGDNSLIPALRWFTYWKGKRVHVILANGRKRLIKYDELDDQTRFPIVDRPMNPHSGDWAGTSLPDLLEDKQRQRSVAINLGLQAMKADLYPMYLYDEDRVKNKGDLLNFEFNKFVGINNNEGKDIAGAVRPLNKPSIKWDMVNFVLNTLDTSAQKATATPDMQQGQLSGQERTLGELNLVASKTDTRYSLTAKVFGWSEREFWRQWYRLYKEHFNSGIDEKVIRVSGSLGSKWRPLKREDIISNIDPDVFIESKTVSEQKKARERILMAGFSNALAIEPTANKRYFVKTLAKLNGYDKDQVMLLIPPTSEELKAEDENESLNQNKLVRVQVADDHMAHLEIHSKATETAAKAAHILAHKLALNVKRVQPELFPPDQPVDPVTGQPTAPNVANPQAPSPEQGDIPSTPSQAAAQQNNAGQA